MPRVNCDGRDFLRGCSCGDCQRLYYARYAHSCTWGKDPRLDEAGLPSQAEIDAGIERLLND